MKRFRKRENRNPTTDRFPVVLNNDSRELQGSVITRPVNSYSDETNSVAKLRLLSESDSDSVETNHCFFF